MTYVCITGTGPGQAPGLLAGRAASVFSRSEVFSEIVLAAKDSRRAHGTPRENFYQIASAARPSRTTSLPPVRPGPRLCGFFVT